MIRKEENILLKAGFQRIVGIDEAGRGPWAGPVVVAGVILGQKTKVKEMKDSKLLSEGKRKKLFEHIAQTCEVFIEQASSKVIDKEGIFNVVKKLARNIAIRSKADFILLDAFNINLPGVAQKSVIKGDRKVASIAAASIVAKVTRDSLMVKFDQQYPGYGLSENKGYGTASHQKGLDIRGPCPIHRESFEPIKKVKRQNP